MGTVGVLAAYQDGVDAYNNGADITNCPGHYTEIEQENWQAGYISAGYGNGSCSVGDDEDDWKDNDEIDELDFDK